VKTLVVYCHPSDESFTRAVRDASLAGLRGGGHEVRVIDLYADGFDPVLTAAEHAAHLADPETKPGVGAHAKQLRWCESLVLIYPTWWAGQPAMLKGWIDRVWVQGVAWQLPAGARRVQPLLRNVRRITVVTSHGSSKFVNALEGECGKRIATRSLRVVCSRLCRTRWIAFYGIDRASDVQRSAFLRRVTRRLSR
jgi:putative NADPH-quinone reductase